MATVTQLNPPKAAASAALKDLYGIGEIPPLGHVPDEDARLGDPQGAPRAAGKLVAARGAADLADRRGRGAGLRDGRGRQLQRRLGRPRHSDLAARRPQESVPHRRLRRRRRGLGDRLQGAALEGRRRGHRPLQSGRRRRRGLQRRRSAAVALAAHLGLRDAGRLVRAVLPRAVAAIDAEAQASAVGGSGLLHAHARHRLPHAVRPFAAHAQARRLRAGVGRLGRARRVRRAACGRRPAPRRSASSPTIPSATT